MTSIPANTQQNLQGPQKRMRSKNVSWAAEDKLNQVRLFAAEDAPSLSGSVLQDLLEAKKSKFMHSLIPVPEDDLPPGFESVSTKRARLDTSAVLTMVPQILWRYPERFIYDPSWQVSIGDESTEASLQTQREVRVLEAIYPRLTAIPASPVEPHEIQSRVDDSLVHKIPLIPIEDEEEAMEDNVHTKGDTGSDIKLSSSSSSSQDSAPWTYPPGYSPPRDDQISSIGGVRSGGLDIDLATTFFKNAGPDVAAAAAAAYAVLKAKESGALIDHELLIKILNNPLLIETLIASNPSLSNQFMGVFPTTRSPYRESMNGNGLKVRDPFGEGSAHMGLSSSPHVMQVRQRCDIPGVQGNPTWGVNVTNALGNSQARGGFPMAGEVNIVSGMPGKAYVNSSHSYSLPRLDISRELSQSHAMAGILTNEAPFKPNLMPMVPFEGKTLEHDSRMNASPGPMGGKPWPGSSSVLLSCPPTATASSQDRAAAGPKVKKQCYFFNTPKGCRNGVYCNFLHETVVPEKPHLERTNSDRDAGLGIVLEGGTLKVEAEKTE